MEFAYTPRLAELKDRARALTEKIIPFEDECERNNGLCPESHASIKAAVLDSGLQAINTPTEFGGAGLSVLEQVVVQDELGKLTNALWDTVWRPANPLAHATPEQRERYLIPGARGDRRDAVAISEAGAGSDFSAATTTATPDGNGGYVVNGEKWFVTVGDVADFLIVLAYVQPGHAPTIFLVDPGVLREAGAAVEGAVTALLCRTSDRIATTAEGARALAEALGERMRVQPGWSGTPGEPGETNYDDDLRDARGCLLEAGGQIEDALAAGRFPVLTSSDCSICITTLPAVARLRPEALGAVARRAPRLQRPRDDAVGLPGRHVPGGGVRGVGRGLRRRPHRSRARGDVRHPRRRRRRAGPRRDPRRRPRRAPVAAGRAARRARGLRPPRPRRPRPAGSCPGCTGRSRAASATAGCARCWPRSPRRPTSSAWRSPTSRRRRWPAAWPRSSSRCCRDRRRRAGGPDLRPRARARGRSQALAHALSADARVVGEPAQPRTRGATTRTCATRARRSRRPPSPSRSRGGRC